MDILVVDDEITIREFLSEILSTVGYRVDQAENGKRALEKMEGRSYDLIITDVNMPGLDGVDLYREAASRYPELRERFFFLTAYLSPELMSFLEREGLPYMSKPFEVKDLLNQVEAYFSGKSLCKSLP